MEKRFSYKTLSSVTQIPKQEWDMIFGDIPQSYDFYRAIEDGRLQGFSFSYLLIYRDSSLLLIAPLFCADFNFDIFIDGKLKKWILALRKVFPRFLIMKTLFCGSPIAEHGILGIKQEAADRSALILALGKFLQEVCRSQKASLVVFKDFLKEDIETLRPLEKKGFVLSQSFSSVVIDLNFKSTDEYFMSLGHDTRKSLMRKLREAQEAESLEVKVVSNIENIIDEAYALYLNTYNAGTVHFEKLTKDFFIACGRNMPEQAKFFLYYVNGKLAEFNLCFAYKDLLIDEFIGFDYEIAHKYHLYFYSWCYNIDWCINHSIHFYQVGQTDYSPKARLGGRMISLFAYGKHRNFLLNLILGSASRILMPIEDVQK